MNATRSQLEDGASADDAWLVRMAGLELGPMPWNDLVYMAERHEMKPNDKVRRETESAWRLAAEVEGLFSPAASSDVSQHAVSSHDSDSSSGPAKAGTSDRAADSAIGLTETAQNSATTSRTAQGMPVPSSRAVSSESADQYGVASSVEDSSSTGNRPATSLDRESSTVPDTVLQYAESSWTEDSTTTAPPAFEPPQQQQESREQPPEVEFSLGDVPIPEPESGSRGDEPSVESPDSEDGDNPVDVSETEPAIDDQLFDHGELADAALASDADEADVTEPEWTEPSNLNPRAARLLDEVDVLLKRDDQLLPKDELPITATGESESASESTRKKPAKRPTASRPRGSGSFLSKVPGGSPAVAAIGFLLLCILVYSIIPSYEGADVWGQVTLDGKPLTDAMVTFDGIDSGLGATSELDSEGHYRVTTLRGGLNPGKYRISIFPTTELSPEVVDELQRVRQRAGEWIANLHMDQTAYAPGRQSTDGTNADSGTETENDEFKLPAGMIPIKYLSPDTSKLTYEVVDGENQYDIKLRSGNNPT